MRRSTRPGPHSIRSRPANCPRGGRNSSHTAFMRCTCRGRRRPGRHTGRHGLRGRGRRRGAVARAAAEHGDGERGGESGRRVGQAAAGRTGRGRDGGRRAARAFRRAGRPRRRLAGGSRVVGLRVGNLCGATDPAAARTADGEQLVCGRCTGPGFDGRTAARHRPVHRRGCRRSRRPRRTGERGGVRHFHRAGPVRRGGPRGVRGRRDGAPLRRRGNRIHPHARAVRQTGRRLSGAAAQGGDAAGELRTGRGGGLGCGPRPKANPSSSTDWPRRRPL